MDDALRYALVVEVGDLLPEDEILQQRGPAEPGLQRILVVRDLDALVGGQHPARRIHAHAIERAIAWIESDWGLPLPAFTEALISDKVLAPTIGSRGCTV